MKYFYSEPFPFVAYNGWGSGCSTSRAQTTKGNNLGAFRYIQSQNKYSNPKPTLVRPYILWKLTGNKIHEGMPFVFVLFSVVSNKTDIFSYH